MTPYRPAPDYFRVKGVNGYQELLHTPLTEGVNALCWERALEGDFSEVVSALRAGEGIVLLEEEHLRELSVSAAGQKAIQVMLEDVRVLREHGLDPALNCVHGYPRDEKAEVVRTDVFSFHADRAPIEAYTWLCTYHGSPSEGLANEAALRRVDDPETRARLLGLFGGPDNEDFREYLQENCFDLHYAPGPQAQPYSFGVGNLWRIAVEYPGSPVPPCLHRAPDTLAGQPRLLLIS